LPKLTTIPVSTKTLKFIQDYRDEFGFSSLDESVENAVRWARLWSYVDSQQRRSTVERLNVLEDNVEKLGKLFSAVLIELYKIKQKGEKKDVE